MRSEWKDKIATRTATIELSKDDIVKLIEALSFDDKLDVVCELVANDEEVVKGVKKMFKEWEE